MNVFESAKGRVAPGSIHAAQINESAQRDPYVDYDTRSCGLSQRRMEEIGVEVWVVDLEAVADACGRTLAATPAWRGEAPLLAGSLHVMACSCRHGLHSGARPLTGDAMVSFAFLSHNSFLKAPAASAKTPFAVAGIAWDGSVTNRPGARFGPRAIREASHMLCDAQHPHFDVSPLDLLGDAGDLPLPNTSLAAMRSAMQPLVAPLLQAHHMCWLGGDHSVTLSLLRAYRQHLGRPLAVIHFDAHCDTWATHFDEPSGHGTWVHEAMQEGLVIDACFTQIGIRSSAGREEREYVSRRGGQIFTARDLRGLESPAQLSGVLAAVRERLAADGHPPVYLSLDIDCLDPAFAPGTGTPEPGGLSTNQVLTLLEEWADLPFVGMDCVEVAPPYDHAELTSQAAAIFVWTYLCGRLWAAGARQAAG